MNITIKKIEEHWFMNYDYDFGLIFDFDASSNSPSESEYIVCKKIRLSIDEYRKMLQEQFNGEEHSFEISANTAIGFKNEVDAKSALDWIDARLLAGKMSESELSLSGIDWGYGPIKMQFMDYQLNIFHEHDAKLLKQTAEKFCTIGKMGAIKCILD